MREKDLEFYKIFEGLTSVTRFRPTKELHESVASHCFMAIALANDIIDTHQLDLDKNIVTKLLIYHDLPEVGMEFDFPAPEIANSKDLKSHKKQLEMDKVKTLSNTYSRTEIQLYFKEFEDMLTKESHFANLIDKLETSIYILSKKCAGFKCDEDFEFIIKYTDPYSKYFPQLLPLINEIKQQLNELYVQFKAKNTR